MENKNGRFVESNNLKFDWAAVVFASRESVEQLLLTIQALEIASSSKTIVIDVMVNGDISTAVSLAKALGTIVNSRSHNMNVRVWFVSVADKSVVWNTYIHDICPEAELCFFLDGYVQVLPDSLLSIENCLDRDSDAIACTGVPTMGKSHELLKKKMLSVGGIHGNLYALRKDVIMRLRERKIYLPIGLYRNDALVGAILCFDLDPKENQWDVRRIYVDAGASWRITPLKWWHPLDIINYFKRVVRQAQGDIENKAYSDFIGKRKEDISKLPKHISELCIGWVDSNSGEFLKLCLKNPLLYFVIRRFRKQNYIVTSPKTELVCNKVFIAAEAR